MKSIYQNTVKAGLLGAAVLLGFTACTDDHFDIQPSTVSGSNTIWQNVEANADLDSVAMILRRCKVMKSQTDKSAKQTYAELLATSQQLTAWLPKTALSMPSSILMNWTALLSCVPRTRWQERVLNTTLPTVSLATTSPASTMSRTWASSVSL